MAQEKQVKTKVNFINSARTFLAEVGIESKKVVWPSQETMIQSSMTVLGAILILTVFMGIADFFWGWFFKLIT